MVVIPKKKFTKSDLPFTHCRIVMFGVFTIKERRFQLKDITSNVTHSFDADSFI